MKKKILAAILIGGVNFLPVNFSAENFQVVSIARAEMQTYVGKDVAMFDFGENDAEIINTVKKYARTRAEKVAQEQAGVYIKSFSRTVNGVLTEDDVSAVTNVISETVDVKYEKNFFNAVDASGKPYGKVGVMYQAIVTVKIDTAGITNYLNRSAQEKAKLIQENKNLQASLVEAEGHFEDVRSTSKNKSVAEVKAELRKVDREFSAAEKISEGNKFAYQRNYQSAVEKYNEAIALNQSDYAQENKDLVDGNFEKSIAELDKKIQLEPKNVWNYYERGKLYFKLGNYESALSDFNKAIELNPEDSLFYWWRGLCYKNLGDDRKSQADSAKYNDIWNSIKF